jgi:hypothetical protein
MRLRPKQAQHAVSIFLCLALASSCHRSRSDPGDGGSGGAQSSNGIGIPECDDYLSKYERCIADKVPSDRKKAFGDALDRTRTSWKMLAANPGARPGLPQACSLALQTAETTLKQYACTW